VTDCCRTAVIWFVDVVLNLTTRRWTTMALVTIRLSVRPTTRNLTRDCCRCDSLSFMLGVGVNSLSFLLSLWHTTYQSSVFIFLASKCQSFLRRFSQVPKSNLGLIILGDIAESDFAYWYRCCHSVVCLFVCMSVMFMHCAQTAEDINMVSSAYDSPMSLPDRIKMWMNRSTSSSTNLAPKWPTPCWFERWRHSMANHGRMVRIAQWSQWSAYRTPSSLFQMVPSPTPMTSTSPKMGLSNAPEANFMMRASLWQL